MESSWVNMTLAALFVSIISFLGFGLEQNDFLSLSFAWGLAFGVCFLANKSKSWELWLGVAILCRVILLFAFPNLSDDIYRFVWDGRLLFLGLDPFSELPSYYIENGLYPELLNQELFNKLNSPDYFSIYPPLAQLVFGLAVYLSPNNIELSSLLMKCMLFLAEIGSIFLILHLLKEWKLPRSSVLLYALNPLIIIELQGNLHFEAFLIFFFLLGILMLHKNKIVLAALFMGLSIASKLITLIPQVFLIKRLKRRQNLSYLVFLALILIALFIPVFSIDFIENFSSSLDLYFRNFEFNASIYFLLNGMVHWIKGYGLISIVGPALSILTLVLILGIAFKEKKKDLRAFCEISLWAFTIYFCLSTTIHPWYLSLPIALSCFTPFRYIQLWSCLIILSYSKYSSFEDYYYLLIALEYGLVFSFMIFELRRLFISRSLKRK